MTDEEEQMQRASDLRHYVRNRLSATRNAVFYIHGKADKAGLVEADRRVARFFELIRSELKSADEAITSRLTVEHIVDGQPGE